MGTPESTPAFAIVGHPNEGKSSVVSTLAENDRVRISATPGETLVCETFPVIIDDREIVRFIDTPGFQNPRKTLRWMKANEDCNDRIVQAFIDTHTDDPDLAQDCELLPPLRKGRGLSTSWTDQDPFAASIRLKWKSCASPVHPAWQLSIARKTTPNIYPSGKPRSGAILTPSVSLTPIKPPTPSESLFWKV